MRARELPAAAATVLRTFGFRGLVQRSRFELRRATGAFRRASRSRALSAPVERGAFVIDRGALAAAAPAAADRGDRVVGGEHQAFRHEWRPIPSGVGWQTHPKTGRAIGENAPWWKVPMLDPAAGDIKDLWEPARFLWVYDLVRLAAVSGSASPAACFVERLADFVHSNPAFIGPQWACGQEAAIRAVSVCYGADNLLDGADPAHRLVDGLLADTGERIADGIEYALSQRNNHGISEAVGLLVIGDRLADAHPDATRWFSVGRSLIERLVPEQFADDGWYIQHSFGYLRLAVDQLVVAQRALGRRGASLDAGSVARVRAAADLVATVIDAETGSVPNHGAIDGSMTHPITSADYRDYRPLLTAISACFGRPLEGDIEPDREVLAWLGGRALVGRTPSRTGIRMGKSGWVSLRNGRAAAFVWAGEYHSRPGHLDALHVDLRVGGREVLVDPGTFSYNSSSPPFRNDFSGAAVHNAPVVDRVEPGERGPRFLWLKWPQARVLRAAEEGDDLVVDLRREVGVERSIRLAPDRLIITDRFSAGIGRRAQWAWTFHPDAAEIAAMIGGEVAAGDGVAGWFSGYYGSRVRAPVALVSREIDGGASVEWVIDFSRIR